MAKISLEKARKRRQTRIRAKVKGTTERPRLCVFRSIRHIYAQIIDDLSGHTLVSASSLEPMMQDKIKGKTKVEVASLIGEVVAHRGLAKGVNQVVFDRRGYHYHGRVKALAEAARKGGLKF